MARIRYDSQNYIYSSARVRAIMARTSAGERIRRAAEAKTLADALRIIEEGGLRAGEETLEALVEDAYKILGEIAPDPGMFDILRYPYDCHNIKTAIKCIFSGTDASALMYNTGSVPAAEVLRMANERDFSGLPRNMSLSAAAAIDTYYRNNDPQQLDITLDRACFFDMTEAAARYDLPYLRTLVEYKADTANILTCVRLMRMRAPVSALGRVLLPGGIITSEQFEAAFADEDSLNLMLSKTRYNNIKTSGSLSAVERSCEDAYLAFVFGEAQNTLYGAQVLAAFAAARETEAKNIRIVISGRTASLPAEIIKERLRIYA